MTRHWPALLVAATLTVSAFPLSVSAQTPRFAAHKDYSSGHRPASVAVGDLNGDLVQDLALANSGDDSAAVLLGNGDGTFQPPRSVYFAAGASPQSVAIADFNRNGRPDLVVANTGRNAVAVLLGNGDGTFQAPVTLAVGVSPSSVTTGDFNGDAKPDLAIANTGSNTVFVRLGNGDGTFQAARSFAVDGGPFFVTIGDVNLDSKSDLVVANSGSGRIAVLRGNGDGTFQAPLYLAPGNTLSVWSVAVGDFNGDARPDLVTASTSADAVSVLLGNGNGTFQSPVGFAAGPGPTSVVPGDFNNDGKLDVAVANDRDGTIDGSSTVSVLLGNGDGTLQTPRTFAVGSISWAVASGDFNGDGKPDLAAANTASTTVSVLLGYGDGNFPAALTIRVGHNPEGLATADFNGDGRRDLAVSNAGSDSVSVLLGNGNGTFQQPVTFAAGQVPVFLAVGDFNRDGRQDLVVANYGSNTYYSAVVASTVSVLLGNGDGTFQGQRTFAAGSGPHGIAVGDFNRDGIQDLAVADLGPYPQRATTVAVLIGQGDGTFRAPQTFQAGHALTGVAIGDFNRDGLQDLTLSSCDDATVSVLLGNGNGTFQPVRSYGAGSSPKSVAVGDFNADQKPDLVVSDHFSDTVSVLLGNGDGTFMGRQWVDVGRNPAWVSVGDLNGDGVQDLAVANWFATTVSVLPGKGDGTFLAGQDFGASAAPEKAILADFNGDGQLDIAVANYFAATVSVLINTTTILQRVATPTFNPPAGTYAGSVTVALSTTTSGATIHYTTNGSVPTSASPVYAGPIPITQTTTIRAMARASGMTDSLVAGATYTITSSQQAATPSFTPPAGTYTQPQNVTLSVATSGATIHYTTDGTTPTASSPAYGGPIFVTRSTTIRAVAMASGMTDSAAASATYTLQAAAPAFNPPGGSYLMPMFVELSSTSPNVTIYYTTDGSTPTTSSTQYTGSILIVSRTTIRAIATAPGWSQSPVASATYKMIHE
jgi:chitobiase/beta-hexosaminidase-like protein/VCBS repeat protein